MLVQDAKHLRQGDWVQGTSSHPNAWGAEGTVRIAFQSLGQASTHHARETSHVMDALVATSEAAVSVQAALITEMQRSAAERGIKWVVNVRGADGTPQDVEFGTLTDVLAKHACYRYKDPVTKVWQLISPTIRRILFFQSAALL